MAMGKRRRRARQKTMWVASADLPQSAGHPFYQRLNQILDDARASTRLSRRNAPRSTPRRGRPSKSGCRGRYFRLLLIGLLRGDRFGAGHCLAHRGFAERCGASWGLDLDEAPPEHSTISRTRRLIDLETHRAVFTWILQRARRRPISSRDRTIGIDATTLEANAALRSIVRRDSGETYRGVSDAAGPGVGHRDAHAGRSRARWIGSARRRAVTPTGAIRTTPMHASRR